MSVDDSCPKDLLALYEVHEWRNGLAVLTAACPEEWADIVKAAADGLPICYHTEIARPGEFFGRRGSRSRRTAQFERARLDGEALRHPYRCRRQTDARIAHARGRRVQELLASP